MASVKVVAVCGFGIGSSMILKMKIESVLKSNAVDAHVVTSDIVSFQYEDADIIFTSQEIYESIVDKTKLPIVIINNFLSESELLEKGLPAVRSIAGE